MKSCLRQQWLTPLWIIIILVMNFSRVIGEGFLSGPINLQSTDKKNRGSFQSNFTVGQEISYDDNIFLDEIDKEADEIFKSLFGAKLGYYLTRGKISLDYLGTSKKYNTWSDLNILEHDALLGTAFKSRRVTIKIDDHWRKMADPMEVLIEKPLERTHNNLTLSGSLKFERTSWELNHSKQTVDFDDENYQFINNNEQRTELTFFHNFKPRLRILFECSQGTLDYEEETFLDSSFFSLRGGLKGELTPRIHLLIKLGYHQRATKKDPTTGEKEIIKIPEIIGSCQYEITPLIILSGNLIQSTQYATRSDFQSTKKLTLKIEKQQTPNLVLSSELTGENTRPLNESSVSRLNWQTVVAYKLNRKIKIDLGYRFRQNKSRESTRDYENSIWQAGATIKF